MATLKDLFVDSMRRGGDKTMLRYKKRGRWHTISCRVLLQRAAQVSEWLAARKIKPGDRVALYLDNCPQWVEIYFGILGIGATAVPTDAKLREQEVAHVLRNSECSAVFATDRTYSMLREIEGLLPDLRHVILIQGREVLPTSNGKILFTDYDDALQSVDRNEDLAATGAFSRHTPAPDDIASIIYTSGTTGRQKGAMLSHANFRANVDDILRFIHIRDDDNFLLVLPLHHAFAFTGNLLAPIAACAEISFIESLKTVGENVREVSPTVVIGVPLLIEKMYNRIMDGLKKNRLAWTLYRLGLRKPVTRGIQQKLGGKLRLFVVGGAPSSRDILIGFGKLGIGILEGYGLTESAPVLTLNPMEKPKPGSVGIALPSVDLTIQSPNNEGVGQIQARGPNVMKGYYKDPEETKKILDGEWLQTGDLGYLDEEGYLTITGRLRNLIVNREGKNIYPEEVENCVSASPYILEALALGYSEEGDTGERVGLIVVPDQEAIDALGEEKHKLLSEKEIRDLMKSEVRSMASRIAEYKRPRRIQVRKEEFEKTSTTKIKRYLYAMDQTDV